jgi:hypothetical protein
MFWTDNQRLERESVKLYLLFQLQPFLFETCSLSNLFIRLLKMFCRRFNWEPEVKQLRIIEGGSL